MGDGILVGFPGKQLGLLLAQADHPQEPPDMGLVVPHAEVFLDQQADAGTGPQTGGPAICRRILLQQMRQLPSLGAAELRLGSWIGASGQTAGGLPPPLCDPVYVQKGGNTCGGLTPAHASWLNQAELLNTAFSLRYLKRQSWDKRQSFVEHIHASSLEYNRLYVHPFEWTWTNHQMCLWFARHAGSAHQQTLG